MKSSELTLGSTGTYVLIDNHDDEDNRDNKDNEHALVCTIATRYDFGCRGYLLLRSSALFASHALAYSPT